MVLENLTVKALNAITDKKIRDNWIYPHSLLNIIGGATALFFPDFSPIWLGSIMLSFLVLIFDIKKSISTLNLQPFGLGFPNLITIGRLVSLLWFVLYFEHYTDLTLFIAFTIIISLDGVDGFVARRLDQCSSQGEQLDSETDAQLVWLLSLIHFTVGNADWWILIPGSLRYMYQMLFFWVPAVPNFPPKRFRATIAVIFFLSLSLAFILPKDTATYLLAFSGSLIIISFGLSLYGGLRLKISGN